ncbi:MAG: site-specific integrase [Methanoregula sp.]|jgi:integrase|nr:site-specific integrase [Methanoregula sp.]
MAVRKRKNNWYIDFRTHRKRYRKKSPDNTKAGAEAFEALVRRRLANGEDPFGVEEDDEPVMTFADFAVKFVETYAKNNNKPSEIRQKQLIMKASLIPFFGWYELDKINPMLVEDFKAKRKQDGLAAKTINNHLAVLRKCLNIAQEWTGLEKIPKIKPLKVPPYKFDFLSEEESERLVNSFEDELWCDLIFTALKTGLRFGELIALDWEDVNLESRTLCVRRSLVNGFMESPKNNKARYVPMTYGLCDVLSRRKKKKGFVFCDYNGEPLRHERARRVLHRQCKAIGLRKVGWHMLRHTFASHLACKGVSLKTIQELLGHSDMKMTMRYAHLMPATLREAINVLDKPRDLQYFGHSVVTSYEMREKIPVQIKHHQGII